MLNLRTDTKYITPDGRLTQAGFEALQRPLDAINARLSASFVNLQASVAATSGAAINFTGIPAWVNRITLSGYGVSTNGTSPLVVRVGDGAIVATGYLGAVAVMPNGAVVASANDTTGCLLTATTAATAVFRFVCQISRHANNQWVFSGNGAFSHTPGTTNFGSEIGLTGALDRVRLTTLGGTDTFDAGSVNISWE